MARMFKTSLPHDTPIWHTQSVHRPDYTTVIICHSPLARKHGHYLPLGCEILIPVLRKMGFKVEHRPKDYKMEGYSDHYVIGLDARSVYTERLGTRYEIPQEVISFIRDHTVNADSIMFLYKKTYSLDEISYMYEPIIFMEDDLGFTENDKEITW